MNSVAEWFSSIPVFTRYWFGGTVLVSLAAKIGLLNPMHLLLLYHPLTNFELWRPVTSLFYYPMGFHFLVNLYFMYNYSSRLESGDYAGKPAEYLHMLLFNWIVCVIIGLYANLVVLMDPFILSVIYIWCQLNKDVIVSFWFGIKFKAQFLPWALLFFNFITSNNFMMEFVGIVVGHLYYFLKFLYPQQFNGPEILRTPEFLKQLVRNWSRSSGSRGFTTGSTSTQNTRMFGGHNWGHGRPLNSN